MDREEIVTRLRQNKTALRARGVTHAAVCGARAHGEQRADSDIDILMDINPNARPSACTNIFGLRNTWTACSTARSMSWTAKPWNRMWRCSATAEAFYAF